MANQPDEAEIDGGGKSELSEDHSTSTRAPLPYSTLLSNEECRATLSCLLASSIPCSLEDLTDHVASRRHGVEAERVSMIARTTIATNLHHHHLPTLAAYGLVEYDSVAGEVTVIDLDERIENLLAVLDG